MIRYTDRLDKIKAANLSGFFVGWQNQPTPDVHLRLLKNSDYVVLAVDDASDDVVGFITAISDGVLAAYIPFLEVRPEFQRQRIATELVRRMLSKLSGCYMIDLVCDRDLQPFYERFGFQSVQAMAIRNYRFQSGSGNRPGCQQ